ncbi:DUF3800 domain-containing protein [Candidatus Kaiserbacteria bacterium]|nr:MAG: DUF3800 domain-containing protein [Candidatus Kaiserbacteria bacterium]
MLKERQAAIPITDENTYYLYIDDSGERLSHVPQNPKRDDGLDYFALGGILIKKTDRDFAITKYKELRKKWRLTYPLHSTEIRRFRKNFIWLIDTKTREEFMVDLEKFLYEIPVIGFAAVIDKVGYNKRYEEPYGEKRWWLCRTAYSILIERVAKYVHSKDGYLRVVFENAGTNENKAILQYAKDLKDTGMPFNNDNSSKYGAFSPDDFKKVVLGEPKRHEKKSPLVQVADIYLYPMVRGGYYKDYPPYQSLLKRKKLIDALLPGADLDSMGIKYSCFDSR